MLDPTGIVTNWNAGGSASRATRRTRSSASISRASTPMPTAPTGARRARCGSRARRAVTKRKAGASARTARSSGPASSSIRSASDGGELLGFAKITRDITERREAQQARESAAATRQVAEDGRARPAHRRRRARLQQPADDRRRQHPHPEEVAGDDPKAVRAIAGDRDRRAARRRADPPVADLRAPAAASIRSRSISGERIKSIREVLDSGLGGAVRAADRIGAEHLAGHGRRHRTRDRAGQSGHQCARRHAERRRRSRSRRSNIVARRGRTVIAGDYVAITVTDTGVGIPPDILEQGVRSVLHHQAGRQGDRARAVAGSRLRASGRRHRQD